jgi:hypothetical protein
MHFRKTGFRPHIIPCRRMIKGGLSCRAIVANAIKSRKTAVLAAHRNDS